MPVRVRWYDERVLGNTRALIAQRGKRAASISVQTVRKRLSTPSPPVSRPGRPPHRRTGELLNSIRAQVYPRRDGVTITIGSNAPYAEYLQHGTSRMFARPFIFEMDAADLARRVARGS